MEEASSRLRLFLTSGPVVWVLGTVFLGTSIAVTVFAQVILAFPGNARLPADCAIVFGTAVRPVRDELGNTVSAQAGPGIQRRVAAATDLYRQGLVHRLFLTGGTGQGMRQSEAMVMMRLALDHGVRPDDIVLEGESHSTEENLLHTQPLTGGCSSFVAVSDRYHLARIRFLAGKMGWQLQTYPAQKTGGTVFEAFSVLREMLILSALTLGYPLT